mmetsp:Transcript_5424/g.13212  ORF Transcript_5424/g.13212 Transcript_5424/m.13212 type:complete len:220 (+) Transcript_5424:1411-2070(+)
MEQCEKRQLVKFGSKLPCKKWCIFAGAIEAREYEVTALQRTFPSCFSHELVYLVCDGIVRTLALIHRHQQQQSDRLKRAVLDASRESLFVILFHDPIAVPLGFPPRALLAEHFLQLYLSPLVQPWIFCLLTHGSGRVFLHLVQVLSEYFLHLVLNLLALLSPYFLILLLDPSVPCGLVQLLMLDHVQVRGLLPSDGGGQVDIAPTPTAAMDSAGATGEQ